jgi:DNA repair exonuclease SbcCD ATPase subunit
LLERYADFWIDVNKDTLEKLHLGEKVKDDVDNAILDIALFLVQPSDNTNAQVLTERLAIQSQQIIALEQQIQTEQEQNEKREQELIQTKRKLEQAQDTNEKRLLQMQAQLEHKFEENLEQSLKIEGEKRLEELKKLNTEMTHLQEKSLQEQQELEFFKRQLDEATDELETQHEQTHVDFKLMQRTNERISADLLEKTRVLSVSETARQQLLKRTNELTQALEKVKLEQKTLAEDHVEREQQKNLGGTKLENALIIDYRHLSSEPAERLVMLLQIYNAFLEHRKDFQPMVDHTNYADFADPKKEIRGLLLLGLEMLLLDGVNLPLIQWLNTQAFRQESVLKQLLGVLESPRLRGMT